MRITPPLHARLLLVRSPLQHTPASLRIAVAAALAGGALLVGGALAAAAGTGAPRTAAGAPPSSACARGSRARVLAVPILMYHRVDRLTPRLPAITRGLTVDPADFAAEMRWLRDHGYHAVTAAALQEALLAGGRLPRRPVLVTFDDGYRDVLGQAAPTLRRLRMPAIAFVITGRISGPDPSFLTWGQLHALERAGVAIGSHTVTHRELTSLPSAAALHELVESRRVLEERLGHPVTWFAYPAGAEDARVVALTRAAGYAAAVTTHPGSRQDGCDPLELHRIRVLDTTGVAGLAALLRSGSGR